MPHHVVVGVLVGPEGVLVVHRRPDRTYYPDCWDFVGGHVEPGETPRTALVRELREELGISAVVLGDPVRRFTERELDADGVILDLWIVSDWTGVPANIALDEHDDLRWATPAELRGLELAHPAYDAIIAELPT